MAEDQWTESVDTAAKTLTAHSGKMFPASQAVPALTQMSARAKETVVERVDAMRKELDDRVGPDCPFLWLSIEQADRPSDRNTLHTA
jgi:hypothetical protein